MFLTPVTEGEVVMIVNNFNTKTTIDVIDVIPAISSQMIFFINTCFASGIFAEELKLARVVIYKAGDRNSRTNFRPI